MQRFLIRIVLFTLFIVAIDRVFILFKYKEKNLFNDISKNKLKKLAGYINSNKIDSVDIAIFGSSHPQFGISPEVISKETGKTCVNFAYGGGTNVGAQYEFIKRVNIKARVMIYAVDVFILNQKAQKSDDFQTAYFNGPDVFTVNEDYLSYSYMYLYSHYAKRYLMDMIVNKNYTPPYLRNSDNTDLSMFAKYDGYNITPAGWVQGKGYANLKYLRYADLSFDPQKESKESLEHIVNYCNDHNTKLFIIQVPEHAVALSYKQKYIDFDNWMNQFASDHKVTYINFDRQDIFPVNNDTLFFDTDHLNIHGAEQFSLQLAKTIKAAGY